MREAVMTKMEKLSHFSRRSILKGAGALVVSAFFLLLPAVRWLRRQTAAAALAFFNMACLYPLVIFAVLAAAIVLGTVA